MHLKRRVFGVVGHLFCHFSIHHEEMVKLLQDAGLVVEQVIPRVFSPEQGRQVTQCHKPLADVLGVDHANFTELSLPLQYVLVGLKSSQRIRVAADPACSGPQ